MQLLNFFARIHCIICDYLRLLLYLLMVLFTEKFVGGRGVRGKTNPHSSLIKSILRRKFKFWRIKYELNDACGRVNSSWRWSGYMHKTCFIKFFVLFSVCWNLMRPFRDNEIFGFFFRFSWVLQVKKCIQFLFDIFANLDSYLRSQNVALRILSIGT